MNERIIEIILYLVNQLRDNTPVELIDTRALTDDGYSDVEIGAAFSWLADKDALGQIGTVAEKSPKSFRVLHETERMLFSRDAYGYLLQLVAIGLLSDIEFEVVVSRAQLAGLYPLNMEDVKGMVAILLAESADFHSGGSRLMVTSHDTIH